MEKNLQEATDIEIKASLWEMDQQINFLSNNRQQLLQELINRDKKRQEEQKSAEKPVEVKKTEN